ncbi:MAG TPA: hypothetical protein VEY30_01620, partial [Myxococcaceae bacterium]|nr:hypothetical protein [Myxococcaceae bacterium]
MGRAATSVNAGGEGWGRTWRRLLERRLRTRLGDGVSVEIHDNRHTMVTFRRDLHAWRLRLHHMFLAAPDSVLDAIAGFVRGRDAAASAVLDQFINHNRGYIRRVPVATLRKRLKLEARGKHHDLSRIFARLNRRYFGGRIRAAITFGQAPLGRGRRQSIKMGSYSSEARLIRIHPALDRPYVPDYFVEWIIFHEMLHQVYRARRPTGGRRCVHT